MDYFFHYIRNLALSKFGMNYDYRFYTLVKNWTKLNRWYLSLLHHITNYLYYCFSKNNCIILFLKILFLFDTLEKRWKIFSADNNYFQIKIKVKLHVKMLIYVLKFCIVRKKKYIELLFRIKKTFMKWELFFFFFNFWWERDSKLVKNFIIYNLKKISYLAHVRRYINFSRLQPVRSLFIEETVCSVLIHSIEWKTIFFWIKRNHQFKLKCSSHD